jgi:hypothetical protein
MLPNICKTLPNKNASASVSASTVMTGISGLGGACNFSRISSDKVSGTYKKYNNQPMFKK